MAPHEERAYDQQTSSRQKLQEGAANVWQTRTAAPHQQGVRFPCRGAEAGSHGLDCSTDHCVSTVAPHTVINVPVVQVELVPSAVVDETVVRFMRHVAQVL